MSLQVGQVVVSRYRVDQLIGAGSGAEVYKVFDTHRSVPLALKLFRAELAQIPGFIDRFRDEANALAHLQHPHIVRFYSLEQAEEQVFILMDFIHGENLREQLRKSSAPFDQRKILTILQPVCSALQYAHHQSIVHCDVKPENILIDQTGNVLLNDFGIALMSGTYTGVPGGIGTPAYMAPEQIRGEQVSPQTDIYAVGIILFEMLSGSKPFTGSRAPTSLVSTGDRIRWEQENLSVRPPSSLNPHLSTAVDEVVMKCLEKDPRRRFTDAISLLRAVESLNLNAGYVNRETVPASAPKSLAKTTTRPVDQRVKRLVPIGITVIVVLLLAWVLASNQTGGEDLTMVRKENPSGFYPYTSACMSIVVRLQPKTELHECITGIQVLADGMLQVQMEWRVSSLSNLSGVVVHPDSDNHNMYLLDNLGNRLDHVATGEGTDQEEELFDGDKKQGWFLFPVPDPAADSFTFVDDDNGVRTPRLERQWP